MRAQTLGQTLATDFRRMAWIYPSAIAVAIAFMAFQYISGVKVFTFDSREPTKLFQPAPAAPEIRPEDIRNIRDEILQSQRDIKELQEKLATAQTELVVLAIKGSELDGLRRKNEELAAKITWALSPITWALSPSWLESPSPSYSSWALSPSWLESPSLIGVQNRNVATTKGPFNSFATTKGPFNSGQFYFFPKDATSPH